MKNIFLLFLLLGSVLTFSQSPDSTHATDTITVNSKDEVKVLGDIQKDNAAPRIKKLNPTKAGLYSAVLPGLGQYYNKKYWKIPIVWGAIGTGVGITLYNDKQYRRYRNDFIAELNGQTHEFTGVPGITAEVLGNAQDNSKRYRDYSIAVTALVYILNIVDAVVDAHLYEGRHDPDLSLNPVIINENTGLGYASKAGLSINYKF